jgi:hypothetical protein
MKRTMAYKTATDNRLLLEEPTVVFRLTPRCERPPAALGVSPGERVRVELLDDGGHLLDSMTYAVTSSVD